MQFVQFKNPQQFAQLVTPFLMANEAENNLMIGIVDRLARAESMDESVLLTCVVDQSQVVGAAIMTAPYNLVLTRAPEQAVALLAEELSASGVTIPGLLAPVEPAAVFVASWQRPTGRTMKLSKSMRTHQLTAVVPVTGVPGRARKAAAEDVDLLSGWFAAFAADTHTICERPETITRYIEGGSLWLWTDPEPLAMTVASAVTPNGQRVSGVYTPPDRRCRGYASALVAEVSQSILYSGKRFCYLFTDLDNPTSNSIYAKIGYVPVSDFAEYRCS